MTRPDDRVAGTVLVVDDEPANVEILKRRLEREGHAVLTAADGESALAVVARENPDVVLLDVQMPGLDGFEVCRRIKEQAATRLTPVVLVTGLSGVADRVRGIEAMADDFLSKPVDPMELSARVRSLIRLKRYTDELETAEGVITSLALTIEARDPYTEGHCRRLSRYAVALGGRLGLSRQQLAALERGGILHDVGKIAVPDSILLKPAGLDAEEMGRVQRHPAIGDRLCGELRSLREVRPIVRHHHERLDGTGYPDGLAGDTIPLLAQIMTVADIYDALTTDRPYRAAQPADEACRTLIEEAERGWRRLDLVRTFVELARTGQLNNGHQVQRGRT